MRLFNKTLLAVAVTMASSQAMAAGFQLNAQSATGLGRAFAGDAVIADNASVMARNPAAMALFDKMELSLGFETITTDISAKNVKYTALSGLVSDNTDHDDIGSTSVAPNIHLIVPVNEKFAWGVNAYTNFGTKTEFSNDLVWSEFGGLTDVKSANLGVAASYRLNDQWSFGAGLDIVYGIGKLERKQGFDVPPQIPLPPKGTTLLNADAEGFGVGFNVGAVFELDQNNRFGLSYHHSPEVEGDGDITYILAGPKDSGGKLKLPLPDMAEFSGYHKLENTKFAVHYSIQWIGWNTFETLDGTVNGKKYTFDQYKWQDGWHYAIGGTYYMNSDWTLRTGYMYDTSAQDSITSVSVPDSSRQWFSAGATYHIDNVSNIDVGFTYLMGKDVKVKQTSSLGSTIEATTRADAILFGLQYSRSF
ncbi:aromatic hydrocarbon degradation protein [Vibrio azureus]|uniref:Long-chain fatty acid transport protein n=1 Tax=Vibrio azureus NBRC 104587 TaxID=1219077 RepID=U3C9H7_9VIBR|nr:outer membrane protein transport protein [Vibrio azureus]AUI86645.1 aromatic hydrocarbon degradation protein [Vibrio azureus]GAD75078.1 long-chain fatty acid transport protein [Vibrio azureus NBRC 104587]